MSAPTLTRVVSFSPLPSAGVTLSHSSAASNRHGTFLHSTLNVEGYTTVSGKLKPIMFVYK